MAWILGINLFTTYLLIKARNKFKMHNIGSLSDLALVCFGYGAKVVTDIIVMLTQFSFLVAYNIYLGQQF